MRKTSADVYNEWLARRKGVLRALTVDVEALFAQCDPTRDNLCLYGLPDGAWAVDLPADEVPPEIPEPALGINFARDGMQRKDWLALVAVHSDAWLLALAFYKGARLTRDERDELFARINALPTCYEVVSGKAKNVAPVAVQQQHHQQHQQQQVAVPQPPPQQRKRANDGSGGGGSRQQRARVHDDDDDDDDEEEDLDDDDERGGTAWHDGEGDPCPGCRRLYKSTEFWIACDRCDVWWCGRCAKMTAAKADKAKSWQCSSCAH